MLSPCVKPIRRLPWVTTLERAEGMGKLESAKPDPEAGCCWP
jgi:hypothetical protein